MCPDLTPDPEAQGPATDKFFYFFFGLRKGEIRRRVAMLRARHPEEDPEQLARRLVAAQAPLSLLGGALLHVPMFLPNVGPILKLLGVAGAATAMMRMHISLLLEIALLFGRDIDERARLAEMATVIAATGLVAGTPWLSRALSLGPVSALVTGSMTVSSVSQLIGDTAIRYYASTAEASLSLPSPVMLGKTGVRQGAARDVRARG